MNAVRKRFHELLAAGDPQAVHDHVQRRAAELGVTYGDRIVCNVLEPLFIERDLYTRLMERAEAVVSALKKAAAHASRHPDIWRRLRFDAAEEALLEIDSGYEHHDQIARLDSFIDERGEPVFVEYNGESPGGIAYGDCLGTVFDELPVTQQVARELGVSRRPVVPEVVRTFRASYDSWTSRNGRPHHDSPGVAIMDLPDIPTIGEFELFRRAFENMGMPARIVGPDDLRLDDGTAYAGDFRIDILYRRLLTQDVLEHLPEDHALIRIMKANACFVANGFRGYLLSHKGLFAILTDPRLCPDDLTPRERVSVEASVPWSRLLEPAAITDDPFGGPPAPLAEIARRHRGDLVIKPCLGFGGREVLLGWACPDEAWEAALSDADSRPHLLQRRLHIPTTAHPALIDGALSLLDFRFDIDPYILGGRRAHGVGIRLSPHELLNVAAGSGSAVPAYVTAR